MVNIIHYNENIPNKFKKYNFLIFYPSVRKIHSPFTRTPAPRPRPDT